MFTGLVQTLGHITQIDKMGDDIAVTISAAHAFMQRVTLGASIAIDGCCMTVVEFDKQAFSVDISKESLSCTTLNELCVGSVVNLEHCLSLSQPIGGHLLTGHVHGTGIVRAVYEQGRSEVYEIDCPQELMKYMAPKGCVAINGVSLTINRIKTGLIGLNIIPHTKAHTTFHLLRKDSRVNIEVDLLSLYVERILNSEEADEVRLFDIDLLGDLAFSKTEH